MNVQTNASEKEGNCFNKMENEFQEWQKILQKVKKPLYIEERAT